MELTQLMDLGPFLDQRCSTLSTGQRQRVHLARALIHDPPIMLLDEPTRGLDVFGSQAIFDYISQLRREGRAVIVTTHRLDEAQRLCDRFGLMHHGRFVLEGTLDELRRQSGRDTIVEMFMELTKHAERADAPPATFPRIGRDGSGIRLGQRGVPTHEFSRAVGETPPRAAADVALGTPRFLRLMLKELRETLRDRRTIATLILMPLLVYPLLSVAFERFLMSSMKADPRPQRAGAWASSAMPRPSVLFAAIPAARQLRFLARETTAPRKKPAAPDAKQGSRPRSVTRSSTTCGKSVLDGRVDVAVRRFASRRGRSTTASAKGGRRAIDCELIYDPQSPASRDAYAGLERCLNAVNQHSLEQQLRGKGVQIASSPCRSSRGPSKPERRRERVGLALALATLVPADPDPDDDHRGRLPGDRPDRRRARARHARNAHRLARPPHAAPAWQIRGRRDGRPARRPSSTWRP